MFCITEAFCLYFFKFRFDKCLGEFGDAAAYINNARALIDASGWEDIKQILSGYACFRGYMSWLPLACAQYLGDVFKIDWYYFSFTIAAAGVAFLTGYVMPRIYYAAVKRTPSYVQVIIFWAFFTFFWKGNYMGLWTDLSGIVLLMAALMNVLYFAKSVKYRYLTGAGAFLALSIMCRANYKYILIPVAGYCLFCLVKHNKGVLAPALARKICFSFCVFAAAFVTVSVPQLVTNVTQGHIGLLPYDKVGAYLPPEITETESMMNYPTTIIVGNYPYYIGDDQAKVVFSEAGYNIRDSFQNLKMNQILTAYLSSPLDTAITVIKRVFYYTDIRSDASLVSWPSVSSARWYLTGFINYFLWGSALYLLLNKKMRSGCFKKQNIIFWILICLFGAAPMLITHIEWRYVFICYVLVYYIVAYKMTDVIRDRDKLAVLLESNYLKFMVCYELLANLMSFTLYR